MANIERQISKIREFINAPRKQTLLLKRKDRWDQMCSALDVIQDTDIAMDAYLGNAFPEDTGEQYIRIYGILQTLVVQQDAAKHLIDSLELHSDLCDPLKDLKEIRQIRVESIGHPTQTRTESKKAYSYHFISRASMHKGGFQLMSCFPDGGHEFEDIRIPSLIEKQRTAIESTLNGIIGELKREEQEHKEKFKGESLQRLLTKNNLHYIVGKIWEQIHSGGYPPELGLMHLEIIKKNLHEFKEALAKRDLWAGSDSLQHIYRDLDYPLHEVARYFRGEDNQEFAKERVQVNFFFIDKHLDEIEQIAKEIDEDYDT
jgi:hypothetical protein